MTNRLSQEIAPHLPYLRRYARALTGSQRSGDAHVVACLDALVADPGILSLDDGAKVGLYRLFHDLWAGLRLDPDQGDAARLRCRADRERAPGRHDARGAADPAADDARRLLGGGGGEDHRARRGGDRRPAEEAVAEIDRQTATEVLIIEDEPLISLDLSELVESLGHRVTAVARTADEAVAAANASPPGLVLADIQLADGSSGLDAVRDILTGFAVPVIFVTSFPERLLTGERPEPTFLITKPYDPNGVKATISQALFFRTVASVEA